LPKTLQHLNAKMTTHEIDTASLNDLLDILSDVEDYLSESEHEPESEPETDTEPEEPILPLKITKQVSALETTLTEHVTLNDLNCAIKYVEDGHDMVYDASTLDHGLFELQKYKNMKTHLETYRQKIVDDKVQVEYIKPKHGYGRVHPRGGLGLMSMPRQVRNALIGNRYCDFDLANAQPEMIRNVCRSNNIDCPAIDKYCLNRSQTLEEIAEKFKVSTKKAKKLMLRLCFFGKFDAWAKEMGVQSEGLLFIREFTDELQNIATIVRKHNPVLYEFARKKQEREKKNNALGCMFAFYLQEMELRVVESIYGVLKDTTDLTAESIIYENDGIKLLTSNVDAFGGLGRVLDCMNNALVDMGWTTLRFENKEIETDIDLSHYMPAVLADRAIIDELESANTYEAVKYRFEKNNFKVVSSVVFGCFIDGVLHFNNRKTMLERNEDLLYQEFDRKGNLVEVNFIKKWLTDPNKRKYDNVGAYPPHCPEPCPPTHFNLWEPFYAETIENFNYDAEAVDLYLNHLMSLCNHDQRMYEYMKLFIAHMFQRPGEKPGKMPIFVSSEGAGKGSFVAVLSRIIGKKRVIETANAKLLVGDFNSSLQGKYLVCLNELCKSQIEGNGGKMREFITDSEVQINRKGIDAKEMPSFHRCLGETNKKNPIKLTKDGRRFVLIPCSDELCKNYEYFKAYYSKLMNDDASCSIFQYFMNLPGADGFMQLDPPISDHQEELQALSESPVRLWFEQFVGEDHEQFKENPNVWTNKELYDRFNAWKTENGFKYEINSQALGCELMTMKLPGITKGKRTNKGVPKVIDFSILNEYFSTN